MSFVLLKPSKTTSNNQYLLKIMRTINWNGFTIQTDFHPAPPTPSMPGINDGNIWQPLNTQVVDGNLQLSIERNGELKWEGQEVWAAAEAVIQQEAKFGKYYFTFKVIDEAGNSAWEQFDLNSASPNITTIFGVFIYNETGTGGSNPNDEIDFLELGYQNQPNNSDSWINKQPNGPAKTNAQYVIQPWNAGGQNPNWDYLHRIAVDVSQVPASGEVTIMANWSAEGTPVEFALAYGAYNSGNFPSEGTITWTSNEAANSAVPGEHPDTKLHLNLWPYGGPTTDAPVFVQVTNLEMP